MNDYARENPPLGGDIMGLGLVTNSLIKVLGTPPSVSKIFVKKCTTTFFF